MTFYHEGEKQKRQSEIERRRFAEPPGGGGGGGCCRQSLLVLPGVSIRPRKPALLAVAYIYNSNLAQRGLEDRFGLRSEKT